MKCQRGWMGWTGLASSAILSEFCFQAEDGIRDLTVTGVQTCALPISAPFDPHQLAEDDLRLAGREPEQLEADLQGLHLAVVVGAPDVDEVLPPAGELVAVIRSEERRVGKEGRSRWAPYH